MIFNCDETGFSLDHKPGKLVGMKGVKHLNSTTSGDKAQMTVSLCVRNWLFYATDGYI